MAGLAEHGTAPKQGNTSIMPKNGGLLNCYLERRGDFSSFLCQSGGNSPSFKAATLEKSSLQRYNTRMSNPSDTRASVAKIAA
jgi:hypothetical protein